MKKETIELWLNNLQKYWLNKDIENVMSLFTKTKYYQETPFLQPFTTYNEIKNEWQSIKDQNIEKIEFTILALEDYTVIVNWYFKTDIEEYDGIYEIKFNQNNECIYFKSWSESNG